MFMMLTNLLIKIANSGCLPRSLHWLQWCIDLSCSYCLTGSLLWDFPLFVMLACLLNQETKLIPSELDDFPPLGDTCGEHGGLHIHAH